MDAGGFNPAGIEAGGRSSDAERLKIFLSYSRADIDFADQMVMLLEAKGFDPIIDRHDIDAAEKWKQRLGDLLFSCDTVVFVLTETSAKSPICAWEVAQAAELGKRMIPILPRACAAPAPPQLAELNYIHMFRDPALPGTSFSDGMEKLERALKVDLAWLRTQTRLAERAAEWRRGASDDRLLRGHALLEAEEWLVRIPRGASVDRDVQAYLDASAQLELRRNSEAARHLAEREATLRTAEAATIEIANEQLARSKAQRRTRLVSIAAIGFGLVLSAGAAVATFLAIDNNARALKAISIANENAARAADARAATFAAESNRSVTAGQPEAAMLMALYGDPAARQDQVVHDLRPNGLRSAREALSRGFKVTARLTRPSGASLAGVL